MLTRHLISLEWGVGDFAMVENEPVRRTIDVLATCDSKFPPLPHYGFEGHVGFAAGKYRSLLPQTGWETIYLLSIPS